MMHEAIGVGIIGANPDRGWACWAHVPAMRAVQDLRLAAVSTTRMESARRAAAAFGAARAFDDHHELVADPAVDLVVVSVRVPHHLELVDAAIDAGKMVFCEWPLGNGLDEARRLGASASASGVRTFVGLQARAAPAIRYVRDLIGNGYVGEVLSTTLVGTGNNWGATVPAGAGFILDRANGSTMLTIPFAHAIDALCWSLGDFTEVTATTAVRRPLVTDAASGVQLPMTAEDQIGVSGILAGGAVAVAHYRGGTCRATNFRWEINGSRGDLVVTGDGGNVQFAALQIAGGRDGDRTPRPLAVPDCFVRAPDAPAGFAFNVAQAYAALAADLRDGTRTVPDFTDALVRHRLIAAIERSATTGTRQMIEPDDALPT